MAPDHVWFVLNVMEVRMRSIGKWVGLLCAMLLFGAVTLHAQDGGGTEVQLVTIAGTLAGIAGVLLTKGAKWLAAKIDGTTAQVDGWLVKLYKPVQPIIAMVFAVALPFAWNALHLSGAPPTGESFASAPTGTLIAIALLEVWKRFSAKSTTFV